MVRSLLMIALMLATASVAAADLPNQPVPVPVLPRYEGQWHEIAHIPVFSYQRKCTGPATATYTPNRDVTLTVVTTCPAGNGTKSVEGIARFTLGHPAVFKVRFAPAWLR